MRHNKLYTQIIGWYGVGAILTAYTLANFGILHPTNWQYQLLNGTGAVAVVLVSLKAKNWQPAVLNIIWAIIAIIGLIHGLVS